MRFSLLLLVGLLLVGCDSAASPTPVSSPDPSSPTNSNFTAVDVTTSPVTISNPSLALSTPANILVTVSVAPVTNPNPTQITPTLITSPLSLLEAAQKFNEAKTYSFQVSQTATLQTGTSSSQLIASGSGVFVSGNFSQTVTLFSGGANQQVEIFLQGNMGYQKLANLAVWRKLDDSLYKYGANEPRQLLQNAINTKVVTQQGQGQEKINKYVYNVLVEQFLSGQDGIGPFPLGLLSASGILNGFTAADLKAARIQETVWVDLSINQLLQRQIQLETALQQPVHLTYQTIYTYHDYNQTNLTVVVPSNLP